MSTECHSCKPYSNQFNQLPRPIPMTYHPSLENLRAILRPINPAAPVVSGKDGEVNVASVNAELAGRDIEQKKEAKENGIQILNVCKADLE